MNRLTALSATNVGALTRLRSLRVIGNRLTSLAGIETCTKLEQIHAQVRQASGRVFPSCAFADSRVAALGLT
jgi:hypothetical protein